MLQQAQACTQPGKVGSLPWREGPVHVERSRGRLKRNPIEVENAKLHQRAERAEAELAKAQKVIEVQGKLSALLEAQLELKEADTSRRRRRPPRDDQARR